MYGGSVCDVTILFKEIRFGELSSNPASGYKYCSAY